MSTTTVPTTETDATYLAQLEEARTQARKLDELVRSRAQELATARQQLSETHQALDAGDETITAESLALIEASADRADRLHRAAVRMREEARHRAQRADLRLAESAGDLFASAFGVRCYVAPELPSKAPHVSKLPALYLAQPQGSDELGRTQGALAGRLVIKLFGRSALEMLPEAEQLATVLSADGWQVEARDVRVAEDKRSATIHVPLGWPRAPKHYGPVSGEDVAYLAANAVSAAKQNAQWSTTYGELLQGFAVKGWSADLLHRDTADDGTTTDVFDVRVTVEGVGVGAQYLPDCVDAAVTQYDNGHPLGAIGGNVRIRLESATHSLSSSAAGDGRQTLGLTATVTSTEV